MTMRVQVAAGRGRASAARNQPAMIHIRSNGGAYLAKPHFAKSESTIQELAKPYLAKPHSAKQFSAKRISGIW